MLDSFSFIRFIFYEKFCVFEWFSCFLFLLVAAYALSCLDLRIQLHRRQYFSWSKIRMKRSLCVCVFVNRMCKCVASERKGGSFVFVNEWAYTEEREWLLHGVRWWERIVWKALWIRRRERKAIESCCVFFLLLSFTSILFVMHIAIYLNKCVFVWMYFAQSIQRVWVAVYFVEAILLH